MRFVVMGAGGMGGYLGARLAAAGEDVAFVARGAHLEALRSKGLRISGADTLHLPSVVATSNPRELQKAQVVLFCVKMYDTEDAAEAIVPLIGVDTLVLTVQNGIESAARIARRVGEGRVLAGSAYFPANIVAPGEIAFLGAIKGRPLLCFGEPGAGGSPRAVALADTFCAAGIPALVSEDSNLMLWEKFCLMAGLSAATTLSRQDAGTVRGDPDMRWMLAEAIAEAARVGRSLGIGLSEDLPRRLLAVIDGNPARGKASTLVDLERGRRLELDGLSGAVVRLGRESGVPTPVHATAYAALKPFIEGRPVPAGHNGRAAKLWSRA